MSIDKALYAAPQGIAQGLEPDLQIEIEDPEAVRLKTDGLEIEIEPKDEDEEGFEDNLAEYMPDNELTLLAGELVDAYEDDLSSRKDWIQTYVDGLDLLGMKLEERTEPWAGACGVTHPLLAEALVKFQSETIMETFPAAGPVKAKIIGKETPEKKAAAERVQTDMNFRLTEEMPEYRPEHERMLWGLGLAGNAFKKVYFDPSWGRQVSLFVPAEDVVVPYGATSLKTAERVTHVMRKSENELRKLQVAGFYLDVDLGDPVNTIEEVEKKIAEKLGFRATSDDRYRILEMQVDLDLPGYEDTDEDGEETGIALPYIVTIEKNTQTVLSIRRNWKPDDELKQKRSHFVHYGYIPGFGFYNFGLIHLIGAFAKSGTSILRQLVDAGTLSNLPGGLKSRGLRVKGDDTPITPGEFRDVDVPSGSIRDNILPLPYKEPSQVLASLMNQIIEEGRNFANAGNIAVSDMSSESPVGTTLAILEKTLKTMSAIQARIHYSMHEEFRLLKDIIRDFTPEEYAYEPEDGGRKIKQSDYDQVDVIPVSDPNSATMAQKVVQYQAVLQLAQQAPQLYDLPLLHRQMLDVLGIKNAAKLVPMQDDQRPRDPVTENMDILKGKPVKAFMYQDHQAHMAVHQSAMQDPKIQSVLEQNPNAQGLQAAMMAHITEHLGYEYKKQIEAQIGMQIPDYEDEQTIPEDMESQIAQMAAQASQQLLQQHQQEAQQQQNQQQMQDPIIQMQMQELQIKQAEVQRKIAKDKLDAESKDKQLQVEMARIDAQKEIAGANMAMKHASDTQRNEKEQKVEGFRIGMDMNKMRMQQSHQSEQSMFQQQSRPPQKGKDNK
jgi:hypothetical protein